MDEWGESSLGSGINTGKQNNRIQRSHSLKDLATLEEDPLTNGGHSRGRMMINKVKCIKNNFSKEKMGELKPRFNRNQVDFDAKNAFKQFSKARTPASRGSETIKDGFSEMVDSSSQKNNSETSFFETVVKTEKDFVKTLDICFEFDSVLEENSDMYEQYLQIHKIDIEQNQLQLNEKATEQIQKSNQLKK